MAAITFYNTFSLGSTQQEQKTPSKFQGFKAETGWLLGLQRKNWCDLEFPEQVWPFIGKTTKFSQEDGSAQGASEWELLVSPAFKFHPNTNNLSSPLFLFSNEKKIISSPRSCFHPNFSLQVSTLGSLWASRYNMQMPEGTGSCWIMGAAPFPDPTFKFLTLAAGRRV